MTPERIEEIKALVAAATPGPWEVVNLGQIEIATNYRVENGMHVANWIAEMDVQEEDQEEQAGADAELIVAAVNSLPGLLAALEEAQQQLFNIQPTLEAERARGDKWEKAFDNADRQYLKNEKASADLRRELAEAQQAITALHEYNHRYAKERDEAKQDLAEAQKTIETLRIAKDYEIELHAKSCIEYQETIARQREALQWYAEVSANNAVARAALGDTQP